MWGRVLVFYSVTVVAGMIPVRADGQEKPTPVRSPYLLPRYNENWSFLGDPTQRTDFWDPLKFIPISSDENAYLSLGGEIREAYERFHNTGFGLSTEDPQGYSLQRYLFHLDFHYGWRFRVYGEVASSLEFGRTGGPRPVIDRDKFDVHQGFFDVVLLNRGEAASLWLRAGRQEMAFGSGRLVALREGANVPLSFDGLRLSLALRPWQIDAFAARPTQNNPGILDDPPQHDFSFWGVYTSHSPASHSGKPSIDFYYFGLDRKHAVYNQGAGHEIRHTLGSRIWGRQGKWSYDDEATYQIGSFGLGKIAAWRLAGDHAYTFSSVRWNPRLALAADIASGDRDPASANLQTFNAMFQSGTYSGRAQILGPNNTIRLEPSLGLAFAENFTLSTGWGFYWRESVNDGLYGIPGNLIVPSNGVKSRYEGSRPIMQIDWQVTRHVSLDVNYIYVFNAHFEEQSVHGTSNMSYISPWLTFRF
ncbi:MAG: alginate export family protein [Acidobacteria bacterium]|nr:alginate export family protein [Acidobacteriota bacterium]